MPCPAAVCCAVASAVGVARGLHHGLHGAGFAQRPLAYRHGLHALRLPADLRPNLLPTNHHMPGGNGDAVLDAVRRRWLGVPVVLQAAPPLTMVPHAGHGTQQFDACLMKPIDLSALRRVIRRVLDLNPPPFGMSLPPRSPR